MFSRNSKSRLSWSYGQKSPLFSAEFQIRLSRKGCNTSMISNYLTCSRKGIWDSYTLGSGFGRAVKQRECLKFAIGYYILPSQLQSQKCDRTRLKHTSSNIFNSIMSIFTDSIKFCSFQNGERKLILQHQNMCTTSYIAP